MPRILVKESSLKRERDRFVAFAFASADILMELDRDATIVFADGATLGLLGNVAADLEGISFFDLVSEKHKHFASQVFEHFTKQPRIDHIPLFLNGKDEAPVDVRVSGFRVGLADDNIYLTITAARENDSAGEILRRDMYSGLLKKESFVADANKRIQEARHEGKDVRLTLLDFPALTSLLEALPADQATGLLAEVSQYLRSRSLCGDTAGVIEKGAYSFVHDSSLSEAQVVQDLFDITRRMDPQGVGAAPKATSLHTDPHNLTEHDVANAMLYTINTFARERGDAFNLHSLYDSYKAMLEETVEKISLFKSTVEHERFQVAFQPIVDIKTSIIHHYECLVRLNDQTAFANPFHFINFGEQAGVINEFDLAMLQKTLGVLEEAAKKGNRPNVAVNVSGKSLGSTLFLDAFAELLAKHPRLRSQVIVEITESSKIADMERVNRFVQEMRDKGNTFCLDDFGTGESSFDYLRRLHVDFIKIDGSYVRESAKTVRGRQMLRAMAGLCNSLEITTIGEMVEDEPTARLLWECGIKFGQGYLFGKPDIDPETLANCSKPTPFFKGFLKARKISDTTKNLWGSASA